MPHQSNSAPAVRTCEPELQPWRAWHIFADSLGALDRVLLEVVQPEVSALGNRCKFFFIRYWERGPHIRARFLGLPEEEFMELGYRLRRRAELATGSASADNARRALSLYPDQIQEEGQQANQLAPGQTVEIAYEPEIQRYGGVQALQINEHLFEESSRLALVVVAKTQNAADRRAVIALGLTIAAITEMAASREAVCAFSLMMKQFWQSYVPDPDASEERAWRMLTASSPLRAVLKLDTARSQPLVEHWRTTLATHLTQLRNLAASASLTHPLTGFQAKGSQEIEDVLWSILFSQIHMLNNRLGITPQQEFFFASLLNLAHSR